MIGRKWIVAALVALPCIVFLPQILGLSVFFHHDLQFYFFPYHKAAIDIIRSGHLPLWNPYPFGGMPLIGDGQTALFYPLNWLYLVIECGRALTIGIVLNFCVAAGGMYLLARHLKLGLLATSVATISFTFNGFLVARIGHPSIMAGASLIPLVFWAADRVLMERGAARVVVLSLAVAAGLLTGHPQIPVYTAMALGTYALVILFMDWRERRVLDLWPIVRIAGAYVLGIGLAAVQILPWLQLIGQSPRAAGTTYDFVTADSLTGISWLFWIFPYAIGGLRRTFLQGGTIWDIPIYSGERLGYVGILPLALALFAIASLALRTSSPAREERRQRTHVGALLIVLIVMMLFAAGDGTPFGRLMYAIPMVGKLRCYARAVALASFVIAILAGFGAQQLLDRDSRSEPGWKKWLALCSGALVFVIALLCVLIAPAIQFTHKLPALSEVNDALHTCLVLSKPNGYIPLIITSVGAALLAWSTLSKSRMVAGAIMTLVLVDSASFAWGFASTKSPSVFTQIPENAKFLKSQQQPFRVAVFLAGDRITPETAQRQLAVSWAMAYGIQDINGFNSLQLRRHMELLFGPSSQDISYGSLPDAQGTLLRPPSNLLNQLDTRFVLVTREFPVNVPSYWKQVFADNLVKIYENPAPLGRAWFVRQVVSGLSTRKALEIARIGDFPPSRIALVDGIDESLANAVTIAGEADTRLVRRSPDDVQIVPPSVSYPPYEPPAKVVIKRYTPNEIELETTTDRARFLALSEIHFPGWQAELTNASGQTDPVPIYRMNHLFRGLTVPQGTTTVKMFYRPATFYGGAAISLLCAAACALTLAAPRSARVLKCVQGLGEWAADTFVRPKFELPESHAPISLCVVLVIVALSSLGIAIQLRDGLITPLGIALLVLAVLCTIGATVLPRVRGSISWFRAEHFAGLVVAAWVVLMFSMIPGSSMQLGGFESYRVFPILMGIAAVVAGTALSRHLPLGRMTVPVLLVLHLAMGVWVLHNSPAPTIDVFLFQRDSGEALLRGQNPYSITFQNMYGLGTWLYAADVQKDGRLLFGYPYMPLTLLLTTSAQFLTGDFRHAQLLAITLSGVMIAFARPSRLSLLIAIAYLFWPRTFFALEQGWTEPFLVMLLCAVVFCACRMPSAMPWVLGLFLVSKQYTPIAIVLLPLLLSKDWPLKRILWRAAVAGAIVTLPLVLSNISGFWSSAVALQFKQPFRFDALSFLAALSNVQYPPNAAPTGIPPPGANWICFVALAVGTAIALRFAPRRPAGLALGVALMFLLFFATNKQAFANYYYFVMGALSIAVSTMDAHEMIPERPITSGDA